jgi:hypothetical protein
MFNYMAETKKDSWLEGSSEVQSNWFKFEKVGDKIKGTLMGKKTQPGNEGFSDQLVLELRLEDGSMWNVGVAVTKVGTIARLNNCKVGEIIGILFESEGEPPKKGFHPSKQLKVFSFGMDPNYNELDGGEEVNEMPEM